MRTNSAAAFPNGLKTRLFGSDGVEAAREAVKFSVEERMVVVVVREMGEAAEQGRAAVEMRLW